MAGAIAFLAAVLYVPFLRSAFRFGLFIFALAGLAIAAEFGTLILLARIKRFSVQFQKRQGASSVRP